MKKFSPLCFFLLIRFFIILNQEDFNLSFHAKVHGFLTHLFGLILSHFFKNRQTLVEKKSAKITFLKHFFLQKTFVNISNGILSHFKAIFKGLKKSHLLVKNGLNGLKPSLSRFGIF